jgi:citrate lyase beta subunit
VAAAFRGNEDLGALSIDGRMVDRVHLTLAERILARSGAYGTTQGE